METDEQNPGMRQLAAAAELRARARSLETEALKQIPDAPDGVQELREALARQDLEQREARLQVALEKLRASGR